MNETDLDCLANSVAIKPDISAFALKPVAAVVSELQYLKIINPVIVK